MRHRGFCCCSGREGFERQRLGGRCNAVLVDLLEDPVGDVGEPGENGVVVDEVVVLMTVDDEDFFRAGLEDEFLLDAYTQEMGDDFGGAVVVACDPDDFDFVAEVADLGEDFPVGFLERRRKSMESKTSSLMMSWRVRSVPSKMVWRKSAAGLAWQLSEPRWRSEMTTASTVSASSGSVKAGTSGVTVMRGFTRRGVKRSGLEACAGGAGAIGGAERSWFQSNVVMGHPVRPALKKTILEFNIGWAPADRVYSMLGFRECYHGVIGPIMIVVPIEYCAQHMGMILELVRSERVFARQRFAVIINEQFLVEFKRTCPYPHMHSLPVMCSSQMPFLVIHVTTDGMVLHCNPETLRVTWIHRAGNGGDEPLGDAVSGETFMRRCRGLRFSW